MIKHQSLHLFIKPVREVFIIIHNAFILILVFKDLKRTRVFRVDNEMLSLPRRTRRSNVGININ